VYLTVWRQNAKSSVSFTVEIVKVKFCKFLDDELSLSCLSGAGSENVTAFERYVLAFDGFMTVGWMQMNGDDDAADDDNDDDVAG